MTVYPFCRSVTIYWWRAELAQVGTHVWLAVGRDTTLLWDSAYSAVFLPGIEPRSARQQVKRRLLLTESPITDSGAESVVANCRQKRGLLFLLFFVSTCINGSEDRRTASNRTPPGGRERDEVVLARTTIIIYDLYDICTIFIQYCKTVIQASISTIDGAAVFLIKYRLILRLLLTVFDVHADSRT